LLRVGALPQDHYYEFRIDNHPSLKMVFSLAYISPI